MTIRHLARRATRGAAVLLAIGAAAYGAYVAAAWLRYGRPRRTRPADGDDLLDRFMPVCDVAERHRVYVNAPAHITFDAEMDLDLEDSAIIRAIFRARELLLGADGSPARARGLVAATKALGWGVLAERPGRELVMGAVTRPWEANVTFRSLPPDEFAAFDQPGFVKIIWTLRADDVDSARSIARTETRALATCPDARRLFRWYWARFSAGIVLIRQVSMRLVKREAEKRARATSVRHNVAWRRTAGSS